MGHALVDETFKAELEVRKRHGIKISIKLNWNRIKWKAAGTNKKRRRERERRESAADEEGEEKVTQGWAEAGGEGGGLWEGEEWSGWWLQLCPRRGAVIHDVTWWRLGDSSTNIIMQPLQRTKTHTHTLTQCTFIRHAFKPKHELIIVNKLVNTMVCKSCTCYSCCWVLK